MRVNVVASAAVTAAIAVTARHPLLLTVLLIVAAAIYGGTNPAANQALARHTDPRRTGTVFGLKHAGIPASTLVAGLAVPAIVVRWGWRPAFAVSAVAALAVILLIPRGDDESPPDAPRSAKGVVAAVGGLRKLAVVAALGAVSAVALGTFMVSAAIDLGLSESAAGWLQFGGSGASIVARATAGMVADRRGKVLATIVFLLAAGGLVYALLPLAAGAVFAVGIVAAYCTGWGWPGLMTAAVVGADREVAAATSGITQAGVFVGAGTSPLVLGLIVEHVSYDAMWMAAAVCLLLGAWLAWTVRNLNRDTVPA